MENSSEHVLIAQAPLPNRLMEINKMWQFIYTNLIQNQELQQQLNERQQVASAAVVPAVLPTPPPITEDQRLYANCVEELCDGNQQRVSPAPEVTTPSSSITEDQSLYMKCVEEPRLGQEVNQHQKISSTVVGTPPPSPLSVVSENQTHDVNVPCNPLAAEPSQCFEAAIPVHSTVNKLPSSQPPSEALSLCTLEDRSNDEETIDPSSNHTTSEQSPSILASNSEQLPSGEPLVSSKDPEHEPQQQPSSNISCHSSSAFGPNTPASSPNVIENQSQDQRSAPKVFCIPSSVVQAPCHGQLSTASPPSVENDLDQTPASTVDQAPFSEPRISSTVPENQTNDQTRADLPCNSAPVEQLPSSEPLDEVGSNTSDAPDQAPVNLSCNVSTSPLNSAMKVQTCALKKNRTKKIRFNPYVQEHVADDLLPISLADIIASELDSMNERNENQHNDVCDAPVDQSKEQCMSLIENNETILCVSQKHNIGRLELNHLLGLSHGANATEWESVWERYEEDLKQYE